MKPAREFAAELYRLADSSGYAVDRLAAAIEQDRREVAEAYAEAAEESGEDLADYYARLIRSMALPGGTK